MVSQIKHNNDSLLSEIINLGIKEVILIDNSNLSLVQILKNNYGIEISYSNNYLEDDYSYLYKDLDDKFVTGLKHLFYYLVVTNMKDISNIREINVIDKDKYLNMDIHTVRNLELFETIRLKERTYSLLWLLEIGRASCRERV